MDVCNRQRARLFGACAFYGIALISLAACGGGGGGGSSAQSSPTSQPAPSTSGVLSIGGTPPTQVTAGQAYSFTPTASGPSGMTLSFSVQNLPSWATFSIASGEVSGTPTSSNAGTFANIQISVSDGSKSASLSPFSITVASSAPPPPSANGTATVSWNAPTTDTNGTPISGLAGYIIAYGSSPDALDQAIQVSSATATSYTIPGLAAGTWYFIITAYTSAGTQSAASNLGSVVIS